LPPNQQDALLLRYTSDLKIKEIACILKKSEGAVKSLLHRGLRNLHSKLSHGEKCSAVSVS
jgi:DNA-directed RNA polymerase specialized sigma24 family protein